jgi:hypothetical protein
MRDGETVLFVSADGDSGIPHGIQFIELSMKMGCEDEVKKAPHDHGFNPCAASVTDPFNVNWFICV